MHERKSLQKNHLWIPALTVLIAGFYFLFVWNVVDPRMYFTTQEPVFFTNSFFSQFLSIPGGISEYVGNFFSQFYFYSFWGSVIPVVGILLITLSAVLVLSRFQKTKFVFLAFLPMLALIYVFSFYSFDFSIVIAFTLAALGFIAFSFIQNMWIRILGFLAIAWLVNYTAGGASHLFVVLAVLHEFIVRRRILTGIAFLLAGAALPWLNTQFFLASLQHVYINPFLQDGDLGYKPFLLLASLPVSVLLGMMLEPLQSRLQNQYALAAQAILVLGLAIGGSFITFRSQMNEFTRVEYYARTGQWHALLQECSSQYPNHPQSIYHINRALCHTGTLLDRMFFYSQQFGQNSLVLHSEQNLTTPLVRSDFYFDLGNFNEALHWTYEAVSVNGLTVWNLQRLTLIHLLYRQTELAEKYLNRLSATIVGRKWAEHYRPYLEKDADLSRDRILAAMKKREVKNHYLTFIYMPEQEFINILKGNPENQFAFEYLTAFYLLGKNIEKLESLWEKAPAALKTKKPRYYQEAMLYLTLRNPGVQTENIQPSIVDRFREFAKVMRTHKKSVRARQLLSQTHRNTYWYYLIFVEPVGA